MKKNKKYWKKECKTLIKMSEAALRVAENSIVTIKERDELITQLQVPKVSPYESPYHW
jgi:hypothetical protein